MLKTVLGKLKSLHLFAALTFKMKYAVKNSKFNGVFNIVKKITLQNKNRRKELYFTTVFAQIIEKTANIFQKMHKLKGPLFDLFRFFSRGLRAFLF